MTEKLKPCAYCQSPLQLEYMDYEPYAVGGRWFVACTNEHCPTHFSDEDKDEVIRVWNARVEPRCWDCKHYEEGFCDEISSLTVDVDEDFYCAKFVRRQNE